MSKDRKIFEIQYEQSGAYLHHCCPCALLWMISIVERKILPHIISTFCLILLSASAPQNCSHLAYGEYIDPQLARVSTARYRPRAIIFNSERVQYGVKWQGIPVASVEIQFGGKPKLLTQADLFFAHPGVVRVSTKTNSVLDLLYKLRHTSESLFDLASIQPVKFVAEQTENSKFKKWEILFAPDKHIRSRTWKSPTDSTVTEERDFVSNNWTVDPLFGAVLARSIPATIGSDLQFDIWNGKNRYLISFVVNGLENIRVGGKTVRAYNVTPSVKKLTDTDGEKRVKSCTLWISADERRDILKVDTKVLVGHLTATLESIQPIVE